jgi:hypothetical protein
MSKAEFLLKTCRIGFGQGVVFGCHIYVRAVKPLADGRHA